jgi:hypothetical protein
MLVILGVVVVIATACRTTLPPANPVVAPGEPERTLVARVPPAPTPAIPLDRAEAWEDVWQTLERRPLQLPDLTSATGCPTSPVEPVYGDRQGIGSGPVYPLTGPHDPGVVHANPTPDPDGRHAAKVLWIGDPVYRGPALIRGKQVDGPDVVRFRLDAGSPAREELRFEMWTGVSSPDFPPEWRERPSSVSFASPGCYAFQVDGVSFSRVLVLRVTPSP